MAAEVGAKTDRESGQTHCLARSVAKALQEDPSLEAVTIDRARKTISVATIGRTDPPKIAERIAFTLQSAQETQSERGCTLLAGSDADAVRWVERPEWNSHSALSIEPITARVIEAGWQRAKALTSTGEKS